MMARALTSSIACVALSAVVLLGAGCQSPRGLQEPSAGPTSSGESTAASAATGIPEPTAVATPLDESQAEALEAELKAIESELDSMDLPSDNDFKDIEGALP